MLSAHLVHTYLSYKSNDIVRSAPHPHSQYAVHSAANTHQATASLIAAYIALILAKLIPVAPSILDLLPESDTATKVAALVDVLSDLEGLESFLQTRMHVAAGIERPGREGGGGADEDDGAVRRAIEDLKQLASEVEGA
jgi:hypothetical protein